MEPQRTPEDELTDQLAMLTNQFRPGEWQGTREDIELAYAGLERQLIDDQKQEMKGFLQGYEQREIQARTGEIVQRLDDHMRGLRPDHQWGSQNAMNQVRNGVVRDIAVDAFFQEAKENAGSEFAYQQAELLTRLYDHEAETLQANGFEPHLQQQNQRPDPELAPDRLEVLTQAEASLEQAREAIIAEQPAARSSAGMNRDAFHALVLAGQELERENER
jgi:hypothetical protein